MPPGTKRRYFPGDVAFANPDINAFFEAEGYKYAIRLPANAVLQDSVGWMLKRPVGRAHSEMSGEIRPASTMVQINALIRPEMRVEVEAYAVIDDI